MKLLMEPESVLSAGSGPTSVEADSGSQRQSQSSQAAAAQQQISKSSRPPPTIDQRKTAVQAEDAEHTD
jgi:hypothetical protein